MMSSVMGRPREHDERTRLALLDAAESLVSRGGLAALSIRAVADEIGSSVRAVYSLFGSKEGLVRCLAQRGFELLMEQVDSVPITADPITDLARAAVDGFRPFALDHPDLFRLVFVRPNIAPDPDVTAARLKAYSRLLARLERARSVGSVPDRPAGVLGLEFNALCQGLASMELAGIISGSQAEQMWTDSFDDLLSGWQARARQEQIDRELVPGLTSVKREELAAAKRRIRELEAEFEMHRRASDLLVDRSEAKGASRRSR